METFVFDDLSLRRDESKVVNDKYDKVNRYTEDKLEVNLDKPKVSMEQPARPCTELEYEQLKTNLMRYHCARIGEPDCSAKSPSE